MTMTLMTSLDMSFRPHHHNLKAGRNNNVTPLCDSASYWEQIAPAHVVIEEMSVYLHWVL